MNLNNIQQILKWDLTCPENQLQGRDFFERLFLLVNLIIPSLSPCYSLFGQRVQSFLDCLYHNRLGIFVEHAYSQIISRSASEFFCTVKFLGTAECLQGHVVLFLGHSQATSDFFLKLSLRAFYQMRWILRAFALKKCYNLAFCPIASRAEWVSITVNVIPFKFLVLFAFCVAVSRMKTKKH